MRNPIYNTTQNMLSGMDSQPYGLPPDTEMSRLMEVMQVDFNSVRLPWSSDGSLTVPDEYSRATTITDPQTWRLDSTEFLSALTTLRLMINSYTNHEVSDIQLAYEATTKGWLTETGMTTWNACQMLNYYGLDCHACSSAALGDLMYELLSGRSVLVGIGAAELLGSTIPLKDFVLQAANRSIWIDDVDCHSASEPLLTIKDSASENEQGRTYRLTELAEASHCSGFFYLATDKPPPGYDARGFDNEAGIFTTVVAYLEDHYGDFKNFFFNVSAIPSSNSPKPSHTKTDRSLTPEEDQVFRPEHVNNEDQILNYFNQVSETSGQLSREMILNMAENLISLVTFMGEENAAANIRQAMDAYREGYFRLVVVGEIKKGKSSFINALLGEADLLPTMSNVATSTVFIVRYGAAKSYEVFFLPDDAEKTDATPHSITIRPDQVKDFGTEDGNPGNAKGVDYLEVRLPHPMLKPGLIIIDTPGLGGLFKAHQEITWRYIPSADAVFFVMDSVEAVAGKAEIENLKRLRKLTPLLFFVQTKIEAVDTEQWQQYRDRNLSVISEHLQVSKDKLIYFPVGSHLRMKADRKFSARHLGRSGFTHLLYFLNHRLLEDKEKRLSSMLLNALAVNTVVLRKSLKNRLKVFQAQTRELDEREAEVKTLLDKLDIWQSTTYQQAMSSFQDRCQLIKKETHFQLEDELNPSPNGRIIKPIISNLRKQQLDPVKLQKSASDILAECTEKCSQAIYDIVKNYGLKMKSLSTETANDLGHNLTANMGPEDPEFAAPEISDLDLPLSSWEEAQNALKGGMAGSMMATMIVEFVGLFIPQATAAIFIARVLGTITGAFKASRHLRIRRRENIIAKIQEMLVEIVNSAQHHALRQFEVITLRQEQTARDIFKKGSHETHRQLKDQLNQIVKARSQKQETNEQKANDLTRTLASIDSLLHVFGQTAGTLQPKSR